MASNLILRSLSTFALLFILFLAFYFGSYFVYTLVLVIAILSYQEWVKMTKDQNFFVQFLGVFVVILPNSALMYLYISDYLIFFWLLISIISNDIFAFVGGKMIGGYKLLPIVSPNKTWSGFFCGLIASLVSGGSFVIFMNLPVNFIFLSVLIAILATVGDLFESAVKRICKVKDSGSLIPGHGGILDRLDSFIFTAPFAICLV